MPKATTDTRRNSGRVADIRKRLVALETAEKIRIIYACESGSRAWGFPSLDSDYDVRFLYVGDLRRYLSVSNRPDVIEKPIDDELDLGGWDLKKALGLMRRGNAPLLEWLASPIVYFENEEAMAPIRSLIEPSLLPESLGHHYLAQARKILRVIEEAEETTLKKYFYVMRALLSARWVVERDSAPPMEIHRLLRSDDPPFCSRQRLDGWIVEKARSEEGGRVSRLTELEGALWAENDRLKPLLPKNGPPLEAARFDEAFLRTLEATGQLEPA